MTPPWPDRAAWRALRSGDGCPMCADLTDPRLLVGDHVNEYGRTVATLGASVLRLSADQFSAGYCVLISTAHGPEPYDLPSDTAARFFADLTAAGAAVAAATGCDKLNHLLLGNAVPHLHAHLIPRYHGDPAGGQPLLADPAAPVTVPPDDHRALADRIRSAL